MLSCAKITARNQTLIVLRTIPFLFSIIYRSAMSAHKPWKRVPIGGLQSTMYDISIVAVIIGKSEYR